MKVSNSIKKNAKFVNKFLRKELNGDPKQLYDAASHLIIHGGKRLRPYLVLKSCQMLGGKQSDAISAASAVEMIHNFTLVHDDIMDNDEMRHGVTTTHKKFDIPLAILAGDVLYSKAYNTISSKSKLSSNYTTQLVSKLSKACIEICEGQVYDIKFAENKKIPTEKEYIKMIEKKTAVLFEVSCAMGAICAKRKQKDVKNLSAFGKNLGIGFQITDDLIGIIGDSKITKKPVGNDIREGKKSLPIILAIKKARGQNRTKIMRVFGNSGASKQQINLAVNVIRSLGVEKEVRDIALKYAQRAEKSISSYTGSAKNEMAALLSFVTKRSL
ncbi:MAG: polyprenyl synthetase family protein [Candidatus Nitrosopelagicus sp.]|nr:polyprenyl synthetase family protein [Candidatus Nitrosopelagicus sp.]|tara:strand:- start:829 stop:1812 length:984 start_codon:yes stop_codon:yes gene_type:complete